MKNEHGFFRGQRARFYRPGVELNIPVYLDRDIATAVQHCTRQKKVNVSILINRWLRRELKSASRSPKQKTQPPTVGKAETTLEDSTAVSKQNAMAGSASAAG
jgi:hypothetical protein